MLGCTVDWQSQKPWHPQLQIQEVFIITGYRGTGIDFFSIFFFSNLLQKAVLRSRNYLMQLRLHFFLIQLDSSSFFPVLQYIATLKCTVPVPVTAKKDVSMVVEISFYSSWQPLICLKYTQYSQYLLNRQYRYPLRFLREYVGLLRLRKTGKMNIIQRFPQRRAATWVARSSTWLTWRSSQRSNSSAWTGSSHIQDVAQWSANCAYGHSVLGSKPDFLLHEALCICFVIVYLMDFLTFEREKYFCFLLQDHTKGLGRIPGSNKNQFFSLYSICAAFLNN